MSKSEMIKWLQNLKEKIGQTQHQDLWHYAEVLDEVIDAIEVSEDCISKAYLEQEIENHLLSTENLRTEKDEWWNKAFDVMVKIIEDAPSVVPSRAEGEWIDDPKNDEIKYCSNCELGYTKDFLLGMLQYDNPNPQMVEPPYCPNCGAKMKG